jgi:hypothetical protein
MNTRELLEQAKPAEMVDYLGTMSRLYPHMTALELLRDWVKYERRYLRRQKQWENILDGKENTDVRMA